MPPAMETTVKELPDSRVRVEVDFAGRHVEGGAEVFDAASDAEGKYHNKPAPRSLTSGSGM